LKTSFTFSNRAQRCFFIVPEGKSRLPTQDTIEQMFGICDLTKATNCSSLPFKFNHAAVLNLGQNFTGNKLFFVFEWYS